MSSYKWWQLHRRFIGWLQQRKIEKEIKLGRGGCVDKLETQCLKCEEAITLDEFEYNQGLCNQCLKTYEAKTNSIEYLVDKMPLKGLSHRRALSRRYGLPRYQ